MLKSSVNGKRPAQKTPTDVDYIYDSVVIGNDLNAVQFALKNKSHLLLNSYPSVHSYECAPSECTPLEEQWASSVYELYQKGLCPFVEIKNIRVVEDEKIVKVTTKNENSYCIKYNEIHILDIENVNGTQVTRELINYRVVDWFDCQGLYDLEFEEIKTDDEFVNLIRFFKSTRIDGNRRYLDLLCESYLTQEQLKNFDFSDTMVKFKIMDLLKKRGYDKIKMSLWKRDVHPIYKTI